MTDKIIRSYDKSVRFSREELEVITKECERKHFKNFSDFARFVFFDYFRKKDEVKANG